MGIGYIQLALTHCTNIYQTPATERGKEVPCGWVSHCPEAQPPHPVSSPAPWVIPCPTQWVLPFPQFSWISWDRWPASWMKRKRGVFQRGSASSISKAHRRVAQMGGVVVINLAIPDVFKITFSLIKDWFIGNFCLFHFCLKTHTEHLSSFRSIQLRYLFLLEAFPFSSLQSSFSFTWEAECITSLYSYSTLSMLQLQHFSHCVMASPSGGGCLRNVRKGMRLFLGPALDWESGT